MTVRSCAPLAVILALVGSLAASRAHAEVQLASIFGDQEIRSGRLSPCKVN